jgi:type I restriction enzyme S subunit
MLGMYDTAALKAAFAGCDCSCNQAIAFANLDTSVISPMYVYFAITIGRDHFRRLQRGVRQKNLNLSMIRSIEIPLPNLLEQQHFARTVESTVKMKGQQYESLAKIDELFDACQRRAFKGELFESSIPSVGFAR